MIREPKRALAARKTDAAVRRQRYAGRIAARRRRHALARTRALAVLRALAEAP